MTPFHVGMKVVCVNDTTGDFVVPGFFYAPGLHGLTKGQIYTISGIEKTAITKSGVGVQVEEISRPHGSPYDIARFRPIVKTKTDISIFKKMLVPKRASVNA